MNRTHTICTVIVLSLAAASAPGAFTTYGPYVAEELYSSAGSFSVVEGLALDGDGLYVGQSTSILRCDLTAGLVEPVGSLPANAGIALLARSAGTTYAAVGLSYNSPFPYQMGYVDEAGSFVSQLSMDGIYDVAVSPAGECYICANPGAAGAGIYRYDWATGGTELVAEVGGNTGGITFDADGNLYVSRYNAGEIWRFAAAELPGGSLSAADAEVAMALAAPGYLAFDVDGSLLATWLDAAWNSTLSRFDPNTGTKIEDIAGAGIGKFAVADGAIYAIDTDWGAYASTVQKITVPEPASLTLTALAGALLLRRRR